MPQPKRVIIVGAGPVGLIAALVLARQDIPVLVLEAEPALTRDLRAGSFHPPTQELLEPLGIATKMFEIGIKVPIAIHFNHLKQRVEGHGCADT